MPEHFFRYLLVASALVLILAAIALGQLIRTRHTAGHGEADGTEEEDPALPEMPKAFVARANRANRAVPGRVTRYSPGTQATCPSDVM